MATNVILPALGMAQDTGKIVEWLRAEGDRVSEGEALVTVETDKALVDLEAPASGILARVSARAGDEVPVARVIAVILAPGEVEAGPVDTPVLEGSLPATPGTSAPQTAPRMPAGAPAAVTNGNGRRAASPKARRIAAARGVDITTIRGTGPGGAVLAADVLASPGASPDRVPVAAVAVATAARDESASGSNSVSSVWRLMAARTTQSWTSVPHFFLVREVNAARFKVWRERALRRDAEQVTYTDLLVKVVAEALRQHPRLNASWDHDTITPHAEINIGLAVATEDGLVVPVIHQADDLSLRGIARQRAGLVARAQAGQLRPRDLQDGTFTISNLGMYGVDAFNAIINTPQAAILAVGRIADRVVPVAGQPAVQPVLTLSLSCDHRVVDGARGAGFLATLARLIEQPPE